MKKWGIFLFSLSTIFAQESISLEDSIPEEISSEVVLGLEKVTLENSSFSEASNFPETIPLEAIQRASKTSRNSVGLSILFPGLGHYYLGDSKTAFSLMGAAAAELTAYAAFKNNGQQDAADFSMVTFSNTANYGIYAAYRDARIFNGSQGYKYAMPTDHLTDLSTAPLRWSVLKKPEVWGGYLGSLALAFCINFVAFPIDTRIAPTLSQDDVPSWFPAMALPVGIGEESLFRGFLQSWLQESLNPTGAIMATSLLFGAAHIPNAQLLSEEHRWRYYSFSLPLITLMGGYLGWMTHKNVSLKESVALHTWYDFTLFSLAAVAQSAAIGCPSFSWSMEF